MTREDYFALPVGAKIKIADEVGQIVAISPIQMTEYWPDTDLTVYVTNTPGWESHFAWTERA